jgi:hypothetical protein
MTSSDKPPVKITPSAFNLPTRGWAKGSIVVGLLILLLPLALTAYVGLYSRYIADDFCTLGSLRQMGFWGSQAYWYRSWSGRYAFTFVVNILEFVGSWVVPVLPLACLVGLTAGLGLAFRTWLRPRFEGVAGTMGLFLAGLVVFETVAGAPNLYQSLYWQTGVVTYVFPLILAAFYTALLLEKGRSSPPSRLMMLVSGGLMWVAVGFSETVGSLLVAGLVGSLGLVLTLMNPTRSRRRLALLLTAGLVGGGLGLIIMALAPGNAVRQSVLTPSADLWTLLAETTRNAYIFSVRTVRGDPVRVLLSALAPMLLTSVMPAMQQLGLSGARANARQLAFLVVMPPFAFVLIMACMAPPQLAMSSYPDGRILISAQFAVSLIMVLWGATAGLFLGSFAKGVGTRRARFGAIPLWLLSLVLLGWVVVTSARSLSAPLADARDFASRWDERNAEVTQARREGVTSLPVASLSHMGGLDEISRDPSNWVNRCFAQAYGLRLVEAK